MASTKVGHVIASQDQATVGQALRRLRDKQHLDEDELAKRLSIEVAFVCEIERGGVDIRWQTLMQFLRALDVTLSDLAAEIGDTRRA